IPSLVHRVIRKRTHRLRRGAALLRPYYRGVNPPGFFCEHDIAIRRPMIAPVIGVQLDSGPRQLAPGTVLTCEMLPREHDAIVEGQVSKVSEIVLNCGEHKFVVKTLDFAPIRK